jgi:hypothetical protein
MLDRDLLPSESIEEEGDGKHAALSIKTKIEEEL